MSAGGGGGGGGTAARRRRRRPAADMAFVPCTPPTGGTVTQDRRHRRPSVLRLHRRHARPSNSSSGYSVVAADGHQQHLHAHEDGRRRVRARRWRPHGGVATPRRRRQHVGYATAAALLGKPVFMTMGNHECAHVVRRAGLRLRRRRHAGLQDVGVPGVRCRTCRGRRSPYYRVDVMTQTGKAVFLVGRRRRLEPDAAGLADGAAHRRRRQRQVHVRVEAPPRTATPISRRSSRSTTSSRRTSTRCSSTATRTSTSTTSRRRARWSWASAARRSTTRASSGGATSPSCSARTTASTWSSTTRRRTTCRTSSASPPQ